jgi:ABC-type polysaccharide/polyol phosphate transport system ATPase subunit
MNVLEVRNLNKEFNKRVVYGLKEFFIKSNRVKFSKFNRKSALSNINFSLENGDSLAVFGHNGSGKSTLLSLLSNTISPTSGEISITGVTTSMLDLSSGIELDLSGYENIFLYGSIIGKSYSDLKKDLNEIIEFSELDSAIYNQVKSYSSGMIARLAFSIIMSIKPDIFFIDEVFSVGDQKFRKKCQDYFQAFRENKGSLVFVTHNLDEARMFCNKSLILNEGKQVYFGGIEEGIKRYEKIMA